MKTCSKCGLHKRLDEFRRQADSRDGRRARCKECEKEYFAKYHESHREERAAYHARWRTGNKNAQARYAKQYYSDNIDKFRAYNAEYHSKHRDEISDRKARYRQSEKGRAVILASCHRRREKLAGIPLTADIIEEIIDEYGGICPYCNEQIAEGQIDHVVPISKGGTNQRDNIVYVCSGCNQEKRAYSLLHFMIRRIVKSRRCHTIDAAQSSASNINQRRGRHAN